MSKESFSKALQASRENDWTPLLNIVRDDPQRAALVSKLNTAPHTKNASVATDAHQTLPDIQKMRSLSDRTANNIADAETVMEVMPEMDLAKEILIGAIIAPKDMMTCELTYKGGDGIIAADVAASMCGEIKEHFKNNYKIESQLAEILRDIFFRTGSWVYAVIPENSVDQLINGSGKITLESLTESIDRNGEVKARGLLGNAVKRKPREAATRPGLSLEAFETVQREDYDPKVILDRHEGAGLDAMVSVYDNPDSLKIPDLHRRLREQRVTEMVNAGSAVARATQTAVYSAEAHHQITQRELASQIFKSPEYAYRPMVRVHTQDQLARRAIGNPLVLHLPSESVLPVFVPGKPEEHIGYFVLLDAEGNPISKIDRDDQYRQLTNRFNNNDSFASNMIGKVKNQIDGDFNRFNQGHLDISARVFGELMEQELVMRLNNSEAYGSSLAVAKQEEVYRIMLARRMAKQHTQLLFLPVELTTYFAVRHNENGIGVSILDRMKTLSSLRMMTMFANVAASMKNSIGRTAVTLKFDEDDPDPERSFEIMVHEFMRTRQGALPVGLSTPADITDWMTRAGFEFIPEGNPNLPDVKVDVQQKSDQYTKPDPDLEERLRKNHIMGFGVSPEQVDASYNADFATVANHNNLMLSKRALQHQETITPFLTDHHRKVIQNTEGLLRKLAEIVGNNIEKIKEDWLKDQSGNKIDFTTEEGKQHRGLLIAEVLKQFIRSFEVSLPSPNTASLTNQLAALTEYESIIDKALDAWIPREGLTSDLAGEVSSQFDALKALVKGHYMRKYMVENGILPELSELTTKDEAGKPMLDLYQAQKDHIQALSASMTGLLKAVQPQNDVVNEVIGEIGGVDSQASNDTQQDDTGGGNDDGGFNELDLGSDNDNPLEAPADNTAPVEGEDPDAPEAKEPQSGSDTDDTTKDDQT